MTGKRIAGFCAAAVLAVWAGDARAQLVGDNVSANVQGSWNSAHAGTMAQRAPGRLVSSARADFRMTHGMSIVRSRVGPTIDQEPPDLTQQQQVYIDVMNTVFTNLNLALQAYNLSLGGSAGLPPTDGGTTGGGLSSLLGTITGQG